ncbi:FkbM family methyltransferase [Rhodovulum sp. FJ3]|uniref:FkbM family methyltransferase n=1 Tax=Rhodovulum sp. FJ3 TaxID=3079053 RepID=UPI00293DA81D|nr:FkbM family methyltransferase [Rhodovulum sp. FJ3]MDV4167268.1 FkbM family methyltransferase [Rhodovulum sp. FJ3]
MPFTYLQRIELLGKILSPSRLLRIVDVGANPLESPPYKSLLEVGLAEVWAFEPQKSAYEELLKDKRPNFHLLPYAVGDGQDANLHVCKSSGFSSLLAPNQNAISYLNRWQRAMRVVETIPIQTHRLDDMKDIPSIDFLKIDIQGGETKVFSNGLEKLSGVLGVVTEVAAIQLYENQPLLDEQMRMLRSLGLDLHKFLFFKSASLNHSSAAQLRQRRIKNQLIDGDAVFVRSLLNLKDLTDEQLKFLILLSDSVFESFDLALHLLSILETREAIPSGSTDKYLQKLPENLKTTSSQDT